MSPDRKEDDVDEKFRIPWWRVATAALLGIALGIAIANGRMWDALVVGVLLVPAIALLAASVFFRFKPPTRDSAAR
jgi:ABC-type proline/glycine betaine transport system permease subunit